MGVQRFSLVTNAERVRAEIMCEQIVYLENRRASGHILIMAKTSKKIPTLAGRVSGLSSHCVLIADEMCGPRQG